MDPDQITAMEDSQVDEGIQKGLEGEGTQADPAEGTENQEGQLEGGEPEGDPEGDPQQQQQTPPTPTVEERIKKLEERLEEKERFIQRQGNEIGILRKQVGRPPIDIQKAREEINQQFQTDPSGAVQNMQLLQFRIEEDRRTQAANAVPDIPDLMDEICEIAKAEGENDMTIAAFRQDPYRVRVDVLYDYAVRARAYRYAKGQSVEAQQLRQQIQSLQGRATENVAARIDQAARSSPVIRGVTGGGTSSVRDATSHSRLTEAQIPNLSDKDLLAALSKRK